jgi:hypothetical protein
MYQPHSMRATPEGHQQMTFRSIVDVLDADNKTAADVITLLRSFDPDGVEILDVGARCYGNLLYLLNRTSLPGTAIDTPGGPLPLDDLITLPVLIAQRAYRWGATDLLRGRSTSAYAYTRQQIEAGALAKLFVDQPQLSGLWFTAVTQNGKAFFSKSQPHVKKILEVWKLANAYERGSSESVHVRMGPVYRSYEMSPTTRDGVKGQYLTLRDTDFSSKTIGLFVQDFVYFLTNHVILMHHLCTALLPSPPRDWRDGIVTYGTALEKFKGQAFSRYPFPAIPGADAQAPLE